MRFKRYRVAVSNMDTTVSSRPVAEAVASLHLGEVEDKAAVVVLVMVPGEVSLYMEKDPLMMEEERGRPFLLLVPRHTPSVSRVRSILYGSASGCTSEKRACHL